MFTVHVGLHKTGSTSIQTALSLAPARAGLHVLSPAPLPLFEEADFTARMRGLAASGHVIVSDEGLLGEPWDGYADASIRLGKVNAALKDLEHEIVVYVRPQTTWLASVYLQLVQQGQPLSARAFWEGVRDQPNIRWTTLVELLRHESAAARVTVRAFVPGRDAVDDFFACVGLPQAPRPVAGGIRENVSIAAVQAPILVALNTDPSLTNGERLRLRHTFQNQLAAGARPGLSPFNAELQEEIVEQFRSDWSGLADLLSASDPAEADVVRESADLWRSDPLAFAGDSLGDPLVEEEMLRSLRALAGQVAAPGRDGIPQRIAAKLRSNPRDVPAAVARALRRRPGP